MPFSKDGDVKVYSEKEMINLLQQSNFKEIELERINKNTYMITGSK
ncbi:hypothetical protein [Clostridium sporogenes]